MRWGPESNLKFGQTRTRRKFAWFPTLTEGGQTIWLESYTVEERVGKFMRRYSEGDLYYTLCHDDVCNYSYLDWVHVRSYVE